MRGENERYEGKNAEHVPHRIRRSWRKVLALGSEETIEVINVDKVLYTKIYTFLRPNGRLLSTRAVIN